VHRGFLKTAAPFNSDLTLVVEVGMGLALFAGMPGSSRALSRACLVPVRSGAAELGANSARYGAVFPPPVHPTDSCQLP